MTRAESEPSGPSHDPDHSRSGATIDEAVDTAEAGSQVEGWHTPSGQAETGQSRVEQMPEVAGVTEGRVDGQPGDPSRPPGPGPLPPDVGSGGAQRVVGARISDRVAGGDPAPSGPPFTGEGEDGDGEPAAGAT